MDQNMNPMPEGAQPAPAPMPASGISAVYAGPIEIIERAWKTYKGLFKTMLPFLAVSFVLNIIGKIPVIGLIAIIINLAIYIVLFRLVVGKEEPNQPFGKAFNNAFGYYLSYLWLIVLNSLIGIGAVMLFFIPIFIVAGYSILIHIIFFAEDKRGFAAITQSWGYIHGRWWATIGRLIVAFIAVAGAAIVLTVVLVPVRLIAHSTIPSYLIFSIFSSMLVVPLAMCYSYELYKAIKAVNPVSSPEFQQTARTWITIFLIVGIVAIPLFIIGAIVLAVAGIFLFMHAAPHSVNITTAAASLFHRFW